MRLLLWGLLAVAGPALAQDRPNESDMFGGPAETSNAGADGARPDEASMFAGDSASDAGMTLVPEDRDSANLLGPSAKSKFDTDEVKSDTLKVGANLLMTGQIFAREGVAFKDESFSAPFVLDTFIDGRPNDRLRAFAVGRLTYDPTRPSGTATTVAAAPGTSTVGLTLGQGSNPNVQLDQLWLRFDIARRVYLTIGRQKVRWGTSRLWFPTDFLNSQPRDALNPFDVRLGVNMVKVHVPVESLGWNFYGYGILDNIAVGANGLTLERLGGALRAEIVLGPAEIGLGGIWQAGRRPRYAIDFSSAVGPIDVYGEVAIRSAPDFLKYRLPDDTTTANFVTRLATGEIEAYRPDGLTAQVSGGVSWQFNYTESNTLILAGEYFYNPMGYSNTTEYLVQTLAPSLSATARMVNPSLPDPGRPDPIQSVPLYQGRHSAAIIVSAPGLPQLPWVTLSLSQIINFSDPSALTRLDAGFRVLQFLTVQAFAAVFYGVPGGELRFRLPANDIANQVVPFLPEDQKSAFRASLRGSDAPPLLQAGLLLRLSI